MSVTSSSDVAQRKPATAARPWSRGRLLLSFAALTLCLCAGVEISGRDLGITGSIFLVHFSISFVMALFLASRLPPVWHPLIALQSIFCIYILLLGPLRLIDSQLTLQPWFRFLHFDRAQFAYYAPLRKVSSQMPQWLCKSPIDAYVGLWGDGHSIWYFDD